MPSRNPKEPRTPAQDRVAELKRAAIENAAEILRRPDRELATEAERNAWTREAIDRNAADAELIGERHIAATAFLQGVEGRQRATAVTFNDDIPGKASVRQAYEVGAILLDRLMAHLEDEREHLVAQGVRSFSIELSLGRAAFDENTVLTRANARRGRKRGRRDV